MPNVTKNHNHNCLPQLFLHFFYSKWRSDEFLPLKPLWKGLVPIDTSSLFSLLSVLGVEDKASEGPTERCPQQQDSKSEERLCVPKRAEKQSCHHSTTWTVKSILMVRDGRKLSEMLQTELASSMLAQRHRAMSCSSSATWALNSSLLSLMLQVFGPSFQDESYLLYSPALISSPNFQPSDKKDSTIGVHLPSSQILSLHETSQCFLRIVL